MIKYPKLGTRTEAIYDYILEQAQQNGGTVPPIRTFIEDGVGEKTSSGPITSTSIVVYHLNKLRKAGLVEHMGNPQGRNSGLTHSGYRVAGSVCGVPRNLLDRRKLDDYLLILLDNALFEAMTPNNGRKKALKILGKDAEAVISVSASRHGNQLSLFHFYDPIPYIALHNALGFSRKTPTDAALLTDDPALSLAAIGMGISVFRPAMWPEALLP